MKKRILSIVFIAFMLLGGISSNNNANALNLTLAGSKSCSGSCDKMLVPFFRTMCQTCTSVFSSYGGCRSTCTKSGNNN